MRTGKRLKGALPACDALEGRELLSGLSPMAQLRHDYQKTVADVRQMQAQSHVTKAELNAFQNDFAAWSHATAIPSSTTSQAITVEAASDLVMKMDFGFLGGAYTPALWNTLQHTLTTDLTVMGLSLPQATIDQTMTDLKAVAHSAGVSQQTEVNYLQDDQAVYNDLNAIKKPPANMLPVAYFEKHLTGFVHGK